MWNNVDLLINEDTNTVRLCGESEQGSALYQVDTLLRISASEQVNHPAHSVEDLGSIPTVRLRNDEVCQGLPSSTLD